MLMPNRMNPSNTPETGVGKPMEERVSRRTSPGGDRIGALSSPADGSEVGTNVVTAIAAAEGIDPTALEERLHDWIDADALDTVVDSMDVGHVEFEMTGHRVRVDADGRVFVDQ